MSLAEHYKRQLAWRDWPSIFNALPPLAGQTVLDLGCGVGDQAAELVARGARVIGLDMIEEVLHEARSRHLANAEFRLVDSRRPFDLDTQVDGVWGSFTAAYFPDLPSALATWKKHLRPGGWIALTEIDDMFGHEPVAARTKLLFESYAQDALTAGRYDFFMGHKLSGYLERCGLKVLRTLTPEDKEFSFRGPAVPEVVEAWRTRLDWMKLLHDHCGAEFEQVREDFLGCLTRADHRSNCKVYCCIAST